MGINEEVVVNESTLVEVEWDNAEGKSEGKTRQTTFLFLLIRA